MSTDNGQKLTGKVALITEGSRGSGAAIAASYITGANLTVDGGVNA